MKSKSLQKDTRTKRKGSRSKGDRDYPCFYKVDIHAKLAELASKSETARTVGEQFDVTFGLVRGLIALREKADLTQKQLADKMGVSQQMVSKLENVNYEGRTFALLWRHLDALGYRPVIKFEPIEKWRKKHAITGLAGKE